MELISRAIHIIFLKYYTLLDTSNICIICFRVGDVAKKKSVSIRVRFEVQLKVNIIF